MHISDTEHFWLPIRCRPLLHLLGSTFYKSDLFTFVQAPYMDPRTKLRYADPEVFRQIRMLPEEYVQRYLAVRNAAVVLR
ncbi:unnamed protein product [Triticum turgidum subsp. durum]|uniref:Vps72/YL1 C-terminal domain-containing protein n=1 Tax=Triticum turgidum subsp. durum TaxID=4567 RepID=A0A9R1R283_TRITD|nr:unnamed protein product [Triticum turgidum subsp. durum]